MSYVNLILEFAILKLSREYRMADVVRYKCAVDILLSEARQSGLRRTQTLAEGGNKCDFRFKIGRKTVVRSAVLVEALTDIKRFSSTFETLTGAERLVEITREQIREFNYVKRKLATYS